MDLPRALVTERQCRIVSVFATKCRNICFPRAVFVISGLSVLSFVTNYNENIQYFVLVFHGDNYVLWSVRLLCSMDPLQVICPVWKRRNLIISYKNSCVLNVSLTLEKKKERNIMSQASRIQIGPCSVAHPRSPLVVLPCMHVYRTRRSKSNALREEPWPCNNKS